MTTESHANAATCQRCGKLCRVGTPDPEARPFRKAESGYCLECCLAAMLRVDSGDNSVLVYAARDMKAVDLLLPHVQAQFKRLLEVGQSQAKFEEIDWNIVVEKWDLPFPEQKRNAARGGRLWN